MRKNNKNRSFDTICRYDTHLGCKNCPLDNYDFCARIERRIIANYTNKHIIKQQMARCYYKKCYLCKHKSDKSYDCSRFLLHNYFSIYKRNEST